MRDSTLRVLSLFVEKADELQASDFYKYVVQNGLKVTVGDAWFAHRALPDEAAVDHFLFPVRLFTLKGRYDLCSLASIKKHISDDPTSGVSSGWKQIFDTNYARYEQWLAQHCVLHFAQYTRQEVMDTFFYGGTFHADLDKKELLDSWKAMEVFPVVEAEFYTILTKICGFVLIIAHHTREELKNTSTP